MRRTPLTFSSAICPCTSIYGFHTGRCPEETEWALIDTPAEFVQEPAVVLEKSATANRDADNILPHLGGVTGKGDCRAGADSHLLQKRTKYSHRS